MKKNLLITLDFPPNTGGVANYYAHICKYLPPQDIVVLSSKNTNDTDFDKNQHYKIYRKKLLSTKPFIWPKWLPVIQEAKKIIKADSIQSILVGQVLPIGSTALYIKKTKGIPYFVFAHGMDVTMPTGRRRVLMKKILKKADGVFANSYFTKHTISELGIGSNKIHVIFPCPSINEDVSLSFVN